MSYIPSNLLLMAAAAGGAAKWFLYRSTDPLAAVLGPGYIADALDHDMAVGDLVLVQEAASPVYQWLEVAALMDGAADRVDGLLPPDGLAPLTSPRFNGTPLSPTPGRPTPPGASPPPSGSGPGLSAPEPADHVLGLTSADGARVRSAPR